MRDGDSDQSDFEGRRIRPIRFWRTGIPTNHVLTIGVFDPSGFEGRKFWLTHYSMEVTVSHINIHQMISNQSFKIRQLCQTIFLILLTSSDNTLFYIFHQGGKSILLYFLVLISTSWYFLVLLCTSGYFFVLLYFWSTKVSFYPLVLHQFRHMMIVIIRHVNWMMLTNWDTLCRSVFDCKMWL